MRKWLKTSLTAFGLIFALTMITTLPTSPAEVLPSVVVSAAVAVLILIAGSVHGYYTDRKHGDAGKS